MDIDTPVAADGAPMVNALRWLSDRAAESGGLLDLSATVDYDEPSGVVSMAMLPPMGQTAFSEEIADRFIGDSLLSNTTVCETSRLCFRQTTILTGGSIFTQQFCRASCMRSHVLDRFLDIALLVGFWVNRLPRSRAFPSSVIVLCQRC